MGTIVDYASLETRDFSQYPFRAADAMVYALLSYDKYQPRFQALTS